MTPDYLVTAVVLLITTGYNLGTLLGVEGGPLHHVRVQSCAPGLFYDPVVGGCVRCVDTIEMCISKLTLCPEPCIALALEYHRTTTIGYPATVEGLLSGPRVPSAKSARSMTTGLVVCVTVVSAALSVVIAVVILYKRRLLSQCGGKTRARHGSSASEEPLQPPSDDMGPGQICQPEAVHPEISTLLGQENVTAINVETGKQTKLPQTLSSDPSRASADANTRHLSGRGNRENGAPRATPQNRSGECEPLVPTQGKENASTDSISQSCRPLSLSSLDNLPDEAYPADNDSTDSGNGEDEADDVMTDGSRETLRSTGTRSTKPLSCHCSSRGSFKTSHLSRPHEAQEGGTPPGGLVSDWTSEALTYPKESSSGPWEPEASLRSLRLREGDDGLPPSPDEQPHHFDLVLQSSYHHGASYIGQDDHLDVPPGLPPPGTAAPNLVFSRLPWVEEYMWNGKEWEVNVSEGCSLERAADTLAKITGLSTETFRVDIYIDCDSSFERHGPGKGNPKSSRSNTQIRGSESRSKSPSHHRSPRARKRKSESDDSLEILTKQANPGLDGLDDTACRGRNTTVDKFDLRIGEKMFWFLEPNKPFQVTIGSFVNVQDKCGARFTCAQTSCEGAREGERCYVYRDSKPVEFGRAIYAFEDKNKDGVSYDIMLVKIDMDLFQPIAAISLLGSPVIHSLKLPKQLENARGTPVKKLTSNHIKLDPDGQIRYPLIGNRKGHYHGLTGVTQPQTPQRISEKGDCGTLITSMPQDGALYAIGAIYGADSRMEDKVKVRYSVIFPIKKAFERLQEKYGLQAMDFVGGTGDVYGEGLGWSIQESGHPGMAEAPSQGVAGYVNQFGATQDSMDTNDHLLDSGYLTNPCI